MRFWQLNIYLSLVFLGCVGWEFWFPRHRWGPAQTVFALDAVAVGIVFEIANQGMKK